MGGLADGADNGMEWTSVEVGAEGGLAEGGGGVGGISVKEKGERALMSEGNKCSHKSRPNPFNSKQVQTRD